MTNFEETYPDLLSNVLSSITDYEDRFKDDLSYAKVEVDYLILNESQIKKHIDWLLTKEGTSEDVNLRNVNEFYSYFLVPSVEEDFETELDDDIVISEPIERTEPTISKLPDFAINDFIPSVPILSPRISIGGGGSFSNPQDGINDEFAFRTRIERRML